MKKTTIITMAVTLCAAIAGCYPTGEIASPEDASQYITDNKNTKESENNGSSLSETSFENVILNLNLPESPAEISEFDAVMHPWDRKELIEIFLRGKGNYTEEFYESDLTPQEMRYVYVTSDKHRLTTEGGYIKYTDMSNPNRDEYTVLQSSWQYDDLNKIFGSNELDDFASQQALSNASDIIEQCGITDYGEPMVYPLHADKVNKYFAENFGDMQKKDGTVYNVNWTKNDEAYLIVYPQVINGVPMSFEQTEISVIVTRNGITEFSVINWIDVVLNSINTSSVSYSSTDAANKVIDYFESVILDSPVELCDCKLSMFPTTDTFETPMHYVPTWEFLIKKQVDENRFYFSSMNISAYSGEEIERNK